MPQSATTPLTENGRHVAISQGNSNSFSAEKKKNTLRVLASVRADRETRRVGRKSFRNSAWAFQPSSPVFYSLFDVSGERGGVWGVWDGGPERAVKFGSRQMDTDAASNSGSGGSC